VTLPKPESGETHIYLKVRGSRVFTPLPDSVGAIVQRDVHDAFALGGVAPQSVAHRSRRVGTVLAAQSRHAQRLVGPCRRMRTLQADCWSNATLGAVARTL